MDNDFLLPPFPEAVSASSRASLVACPRRFYYNKLLRLAKREGKSVHLHFGGVIAKGLEITRRSYWQDGLDEQNAIAAGIVAMVKEWGDFEIPPEIENKRAGIKNFSAAIDALVSYFEHHQLGNDPIKPVIIDGIALVEQSFELPLLGTQHPITGKPINYVGRFDMIGYHQDALFIVDDKTSLSLGDAWRSNWIVRGQITGYCWGAPSILPEGSGISGGIIRGIGILKQSIAFEQVIVSRPPWQIEQWHRQLVLDVNRAIAVWEQMHHRYHNSPHLAHMAWDQSLDSACSDFGGCAYLDLCDSPDPTNWYDNYFINEPDLLAQEKQ